MESSRQKYGLISCGSQQNLGTQIYTIAVKEFLSKVDYLVDYDTGKISVPDVKEETPSQIRGRISSLLHMRGGAVGANFSGVSSSARDGNLNTSSTRGVSSNRGAGPSPKPPTSSTSSTSSKASSPSISCTTGSTDKIKTLYSGVFSKDSVLLPPNSQLDPLFISFSLEEPPSVKVRRNTPVPVSTNLDQLAKHAPIGCADLATMEILAKRNIKSYFSGSLITTLQAKSKVKTGEILVVDAHINAHTTFNNLVPRLTRRKAVYLSQSVVKKVSETELVKLTEDYLKRLSEATLVLTSKLETALACLAYNTPVIVLLDDTNMGKFASYSKFLTILTPNSKLTFELESYKNPAVLEFKTMVNTLKAKVTSWLIHNEEVKDGYSIFTACMNRTQNLEKALPSWLATNPDEIVIVDWGSNPPIKPLVEKYNAAELAKGGKAKIRLITVPNVDKWVLTWAFNLAAKFTRRTKILKVDCDTILQPNFFSYHNLDRGKHFFAGDWRKARSTNECYTNGIVYLLRESFFKALGYDEGITTYGWDDCSAYDRLEKTLERLPIDVDTVAHIEHSDELRIANQKLAYGTRLDIEIERNRLIACLNLWKGDYSTYDITMINTEEYIARHVSSVVIDESIRSSLLLKAVSNREYAMAQIKKEEEEKKRLEFGALEKDSKSSDIKSSSDTKSPSDGKSPPSIKSLSNGRSSDKKNTQDGKSSPKDSQLVKRKKKLYINAKNGLGNKIRAIASAYNIAMEAGYELVIIWIPDNHCGAKFHDIFKINDLLKDIVIIDFDLDEIDMEIIKYDVLENEYIVKERIIYNYISGKGIVIDTDTHDKDLYIMSACVLKSKHTNWAKECAFLQKLELVDSIQAKIESFKQEHDIANTIGVHIRMGQPVAEHDYEDVSKYSIEGKLAMTKWRTASHYSVFLRELQRITLVKKNQKFFLCCDNPEAYKEILKEMPHNIIFTEKKDYTRSADQIVSAAVDMWLLKDTKYQLLSPWSSFGEGVERLCGKKPMKAGIDFF
jgi:hypothetical protein